MQRHFLHGAVWALRERADEVISTTKGERKLIHVDGGSDALLYVGQAAFVDGANVGAQRIVKYF